MKECNKCKQWLDGACFNKNKTKRDGLQLYCRDCQHKKFKEYYCKNKEYHVKQIRAKSKVYVQQLRCKVNDIKIAHGCLICAENECCCLVFHHLDPEQKDRNVSMLVANGVKWQTILDEIAKCIVLCENCHRKLHAGKIILPLSYNRLL